MSKERLEEIKQTINHPNYTEHNGQEEIYFMVSDNDFNWLIEQAERVQEYDRELISLEDNEHFVAEILEQNKRYREALKNIYELAEYDEYDNTLEQIVSEVEKALEE